MRKKPHVFFVSKGSEAAFGPESPPPQTFPGSGVRWRGSVLGARMGEKNGRKRLLFVGTPTQWGCGLLSAAAAAADAVGLRPVERCRCGQ